MSNYKPTPQADHRQWQHLRVNASASLAEEYLRLKSLTVNLGYYEAGGMRKITEVKYTVNLAHAKSVFVFTCPKTDCVEGDFDLSEELASAVADHLTTATGELWCQGWRKGTTRERMQCRSMLRYRLNLSY